MQKNLQYGFQSVLALNTLYGFSELETLSLQYLEDDVLNIKSKVKTWQSSATLSGGGDKESGGQTKEDSEISQDGIESREKKARS